MPYLVIPGIMVSVEDHGSTQATSWVDTSSCNGDGCQMHQVDCKPNGKGRKYLPHTMSHDTMSTSTTGPMPLGSTLGMWVRATPPQVLY